MSTRGLILLLAACLCTVSGNLLLRAGVVAAGGFRLSSGATSQLLKLAYQPKFVSGFILYGLASLFWFSVISMENLSTDYPVLVSISFVLVTFGSVFFFGESISPQKLIGMAVILAGIVVVLRG
jgi:multidrug transporter EmrE-like cation transporter